VRLSVVVPTLDEAARIGAALDALLSLRDVHEVVVVDGGSADDTVAVARSRPGVEVLSSTRGRGRQMNVGARAVTGDAVLFLHADARLPHDAARWVAETLARPGVVAGAFRTWTVSDDGRHWLSPLLHLADLRSRYTRLPYGDQAPFMTVEAFVHAGGFPEQPLMEDLEFARRLARLGRFVVVPARVTVSGRRFLARPLYYTALVNLFPALYRLGVPPRALAALYRPVR
jgi:rSAM/selenodomain-associated transferase 2